MSGVVLVEASVEEHETHSMSACEIRPQPPRKSPKIKAIKGQGLAKKIRAMRIKTSA